MVNLYPFESTVADPECPLADAVENIDIGGPAMLRGAAKNYDSVAAVVDPADYPRVLQEIRTTGSVSPPTRFQLARKVFAHTAAYDGAIANYLTSLDGERRSEYPEVLTLQFRKLQDLRYGENPHQSAAFYRDTRPVHGGLASYRQLQGKELSYNNIADADAAWECVKQFEQPACVIIKHANPCGVAVGASLLDAYEKAFATDPASAFGGILGFNRALDAAAAQALGKQFAEVVIAPRVEPDALRHLQAKANLRILEVPLAREHQAHDYKRIGGGLLVQSSDARMVERKERDARRRRGADEPRRQRAHRRAEGSRRQAFARRRGGGVGRLLPVPRWPRRARRGRGARGDPARRQRARRRGDRRRRPARHRHGVHRRAPLQALT